MSMHNWTVCRIILQISIFLSISKMCKSAICHFICTFISENQDLGRLRSVSNLTKISGPASRDFFLGLYLKKIHSQNKEAENVKDTKDMGYDVMK